MAVRGIDVSRHNGVIDWNKVKGSGVEFVIIRAGYGRVITQKDDRFETNYSGAKAAGLKVGAYWYSYAMNAYEAELEANVFLEAIKGKQFEYPVFLDLEENKQFATGRANVSGMVDRFCRTVEKAGYYTGLYMSRAQLLSYVDIDVRNRYCVWCAEWAAKCTYSGAYGLWQYSEKGHVDGINGNVDLDYAYADFPTIIKGKHLNGFEKTEPTPTVVYNVVAAEFKSRSAAESELKRLKLTYPEAKIKATTTVKL